MSFHERHDVVRKVCGIGAIARFGLELVIALHINKFLTYPLALLACIYTGFLW